MNFQLLKTSLYWVSALYNHRGHNQSRIYTRSWICVCVRVRVHTCDREYEFQRNHCSYFLKYKYNAIMLVEISKACSCEYGLFMCE